MRLLAAIVALSGVATAMLAYSIYQLLWPIAQGLF